MKKQSMSVSTALVVGAAIDQILASQKAGRLNAHATSALSSVVVRSPPTSQESWDARLKRAEEASRLCNAAGKPALAQTAVERDMSAVDVRKMLAGPKTSATPAPRVTLRGVDAASSPSSTASQARLHPDDIYARRRD